MKRFGLAGLLVGVFLVWPHTVTAQDPPPPTAPPEASDTELAFEREVFVYPTFDLANPFRPLDAADTGGPRFERLRLSGIIYSETPGRSIATLSTSTVTIGTDGSLTAGPGDSYYLKVGQTIGNTTVIEINSQSIEVDVEEFGVTGRKTMRLMTALGGMQ